MKTKLSLLLFVSLVYANDLNVGEISVENRQNLANGGGGIQNTQVIKYIIFKTQIQVKK